MRNSVRALVFMRRHPSLHNGRVADVNRLRRGLAAQRIGKTCYISLCGFGQILGPDLALVMPAGRTRMSKFERS